MAESKGEKPSGPGARTRGASGKLWGGRFEGQTNAGVERFTASIHFDRVLARFDLRGSTAHARMLAKQSIISEADADAIVEGLEAIRELGSEAQTRIAGANAAALYDL